MSVMRRAERISKDHRLAERPSDICDLEDAARRASYLGSIEHKTCKSPAGAPSPRRDASKCPRLPEERWPELSEALRKAIRTGCISDVIDPGNLPRYVWGRFDGGLYEARRLSNPPDKYKAYPVEEFELPEGAIARMEAEGGHG